MPPGFDKIALLSITDPLANSNMHFYSMTKSVHDNKGIIIFCGYLMEIIAARTLNTLVL